VPRAVLLVPILALGCVSGTSPTPTEPGQPDLDYPVGSFSLTERSGRTVTEQDLRGKVWVASFIFTRCIGPCPAVTSTVAKLQEEFRNDPGVAFVTFTVDPARDDLKALNEYAISRNADPDRWLFLTGDEAVIHALMREQFKQPVERKGGPDVKPGDEFGHSSRLVLVDKKGTIRGMFAGLPDEHFSDRFSDDQARLRQRIRELLDEQ
jgi:cytochrome oxidase Cu insertion factor (SCO1/SenC/PrrC family)